MAIGVVLAAEGGRQRDELRHVGLKAGPEAGERGQGRAGEQHEEEEQHGHSHVDLGKPLHTTLQTAPHRDQRHCGDGCDHDHLSGDADVQAEDEVHAGVGLLGAEAERGGQAK